MIIAYSAAYYLGQLTRPQAAV